LNQYRDDVTVAQKGGERMTATASSGTLLIVEDNRSLLRAYCAAFAKHGWVVLAAESGYEARERLARETPQLAIVDLVLSRESGIDVIKTLKCDLEGLRIILVTGYPSWENVRDAWYAGAEAVLEKPIKPHDVIEWVTKKQCRQRTVADLVPTLGDVKREHIHRVITDSLGNVSEAARRLRLTRSSLQRMLRANDDSSYPKRAAQGTDD
jgi:ActR/RegA family two-component response regulator